MREGLVVVILLMLAVSASDALELREIWRFRGGSPIASPTLLRSAHGAPVEGIVFTVGDGRLVCLDGAGDTRWTRPIAPLSHAAPAVGDVDGDGAPEMVALDAEGVLHCLSAGGQTRWTARLRAGSRQQNGAGLYDLDGDGVLEIVVGDGAGTVWCFDGAGNVRWTTDVGGGRLSMPTIADLDGDGRPEIVIGDNHNRCHCLGSDGDWRWTLWREDDVFVNSNAAVADLTGDGLPEVAIGGGLHHFYTVAGATGEVVREMNTRDHINSAIASADLDGDGVIEVVFGTRNRGVYRIGRGAQVMWTSEVDSSIMAAPAVADLTGDGRAEMAWLVRGAGLVVMDADGSELARAPIGDSGWASPALGDVDGDGRLEIVAPANGGNDLACLATGAAARPGAVRWESLRGDAACSGNPHGVNAARRADAAPTVAAGATFRVSEEFSWLCGANRRVYSVANPQDQRLVLVQTAAAPGGAVARALRYVSEPSASVDCDLFVEESGAHRISARLYEVTRRALVQEQSTAEEVDLFARDAAEAERTVALLEQAADALGGALPEAREYLRRARLETEGRLRRLERARGDALPPGGGARLIADEMSSRRRAEHLLRLARFILARPEPERGRAFVAWEAFPWHGFDATSAAPPLAPSTILDFETYLREGESRCFNITNFRGGAAAYRVEMGEVKHLQSGAVMPASCFELREATEAPTTAGRMMTEALIPLNEARAVVVGPWESRQVWLTLTAAGVEPGLYLGRLAVTSVEPAPAREEIEVRVRVWPLEIPYPGRVRFCNWGAVPRADDEFGQSLVRRVRGHGVNVIPLGSPRARYDENGDLAAPIDFTAVEAALRLYPDATFLHIAPQASVSVAGAERFSEKWIACYRKYLADWVAHFESLGLGFDRFMLYPVDEPSLAGSPQLIEFTTTARITKEIDPRIQIYINPSMGSTIEGMTEPSRYVDVWAPSQELMDREGVPLLDFFKRTGHEVWFYDARGDSRLLSGIAYFRWQAWQAWHLGLTGMGFFACMALPDYAWIGPNTMGQGAYWDIVYPGTRAIASKRYDGARDGKEDLEAMLLLRDALEAAKAGGAAGAAVEAAEQLLGDEAESIWQALDALDKYCEVSTDGAATRAVVEQLRAFRRRVAEATLALRRLAPDQER